MRKKIALILLSIVALLVGGFGGACLVLKVCMASIEKDSTVVAKEFLNSLISGSFVKLPTNPDDITASSATLGTNELDRKYLTWIPSENRSVVASVQRRMERYQDLEITQITLTEVTRHSPTPAELAENLGDQVTLAISLAQRPKGQSLTWETANEGQIILRWYDPNALGMDLASGWHISDLTS